MTDYTRLDEAIVATIKAGKRTFTEIWLTCEREADAIGKDGYRATDRRLQSLRKRGLIAYAKGAWGIVA